MVSLSCPRCGRAIQVSDSLRGGPIRCARCGTVLTDAAAREPKTEIGRDPVVLAAAQSDDERATTDQAKNGDTLTPRERESIEPGYPFLAPAKGANELGWLAHYQVLRVLGQGGMGIIFEAFDTELQRQVALKVMKPEIAQDEVARQRFLREARVMASLKSDYVVTIHQVGVHKNVPFLAAEFLQGESLDRWLVHRGRPGVAEILRLSIEIGRGLMAAHEHGLIHRDIKPANIFLESRGENRCDGHVRPGMMTPPASRRTVAQVRAKILDFGLVQIGGKRSQLTNPRLVMGTPAYMSPEQVEGGAVDARCDLFSLGCVMYEMATGAQPFTGENSIAVLMAVATKHPKPPRELNPDLPPPLAKLILQLLAKRPRDRLNSAGDVVAALEGIGQKLGIATATPSSGSERILDVSHAAPSPWRRKLAFGLALVLSGALVGSLLVAYLLSRPAARLAETAAVQGVSDSDILFGMTGPFSGPAREVGLEMKVGIDTYFRYINDRGGVLGRKLNLVDLDDGYEPDRALANMAELYERHKVFGFIGNVGTPTAVKTLPYALEKKALDFAPFSGASFLRREPPDRHVFTCRAGYAEETFALVKYLLEVRRVRPDELAVFAQNDAYGDDGFRGAVKAVKLLSHDPKSILRVGYDRNSLKVNDAVKTIHDYPGIHAIVLVASYKPAAAFIEKVKNVRPTMIFACVSGVGGEALAEGLVEQGPHYADGVIVTQVVPPVDSGATLVLKYRNSLKKYHPSERPNSTSLEGYIDAAILVEGLKRTGRDLTTDALIDALESIRDFDLGTGTPFSLSPSRHQASHKVWGTILDRDGSFHQLALDE